MTKKRVLKPISSDLRHQLRTLVSKNGIMHVADHSGWSTSRIYAVMKDQQKSFMPSTERAMLDYIRRFHNGSNSKALPAPKKNDHDDAAAEDVNVAALVLDLQISLTYAETAALLAKCHAHNCCPEEWVKAVIEEAIR